MKKYFLILAFLMVCGNAFCEDRVNVQVIFRKGIFQCQDGSEEVVDFNMSGGNEYEHICADGKWTNKFVNYSGSVSYDPEEYETLKEADLIAKKDQLVADFIYQKNNPPEYVEPTEEEYKKMIDEKMEEITIYSEKITDATILESIKTDYETKITEIDSKVISIEPIEKEIIK